MSVCGHWSYFGDCFHCQQRADRLDRERHQERQRRHWKEMERIQKDRARQEARRSRQQREAQLSPQRSVVPEPVYRAHPIRDAATSTAAEVARQAVIAAAPHVIRAAPHLWQSAKSAPRPSKRTVLTVGGVVLGIAVLVPLSIVTGIAMLALAVLIH